MMMRTDNLLCAGVILLAFGVCTPAIAQEPLEQLSGDEINFNSPILLRAQIVPKQFSTLSSEMAGVINRMDVREGSAFPKGSILVAFNCDEEKSLLTSARATYELTSRKNKIQKRLDKLGTTSIMKTEIAKADAIIAESDFKRAAARVGRCEVVAPFSGKVSDLLVQKYQFVKRGDELMRIVDTSVLEVEVIIPSDWLKWLKVGYLFSVTLDETGKAHKAKVSNIGAWIDPVSRSIKITGQIIDNKVNLIPGMSGQVMLVPPKI